jgi:signal transduction histidine kinase
LESGVVASLPLGLVALAAIAIFAAGVIAGWLAARARAQRHAPRTSDLLDALSQATLIADADGHIIARNIQAAERLDADLPLAVDAAIGRVTRSRVPESLEIASLGSVDRRLRVSVTPLAAGGSSPHALVVFTDPESGRAEVYQRLISMIAHELRTPLTAIMGHVDILNSCRMDEEALWRRSLGFVAGEVERLARLVEDLLGLSRLDQMPLHLQAMNLRSAAEEAISALFDTAERNHVALVLQAPDTLPRVQADPDRIRQVFLNLIDNAVKYAPGGMVTVQLSPDDEKIRIEIGDTGPGISPDDLPHIFEPLYRGSRTPTGSSGTGLGLTIVRTILDQHNAPIRIQSLLGQGTTFSFSLPIAK